MLGTGSPPKVDEENNHAVSPPLSFHNVVSRSSTPGLSSLDGTPQYLYVSQEPPLSSAPPSILTSDMAIRPAPPLSHGRQPEQEQVGLAEISVVTNASPEISNGLPSEDVPSVHHPKAAEETERVAPLSEISRLLRLQRFQHQRCSKAGENLQCLQIAAARTARLALSARSIQRTLAECIKGEDKHSFANLLHAFHDACDECLRTPDASNLGPEAGESFHHANSSPYLQDLSKSSQANILDFVTRLRNDADFIAQCLASLSQKELLALLPERFAARSTESILGGQSRISSRSVKPLGYTVDTQIDLLSHFGHVSALEALIYAARSVTGAERLEQQKSTGIWATVCAKLISERKEGSEKLIPAVLDIWCASRPWPGKDRMEVWILQTLQNGSFLLGQSAKQSFRARVEGRNDLTNEDETRAEAFYTQSANALLDLLADDNGPEALPPGALEMCHAMWNSLSSSVDYQRTLPMFLSTRWLFTTFLPDMLTMPEAYGLLVDHYVPDLARQRILREVAIRAQKAAFDVAYCWKHSNALPADSIQRVHKVLSRLQGKPVSTSTQAVERALNNTETFVVISAKDVVQCLNGLYPRRRRTSIASDSDISKSGLQSSASSVSGFSLFSNARPSDQIIGSTTSELRNLRFTDSALTSDSCDQEDLAFLGFREACSELEELTSGHLTDARDLWEVLYSSSMCVSEPGEALKSMLKALGKNAANSIERSAVLATMLEGWSNLLKPTAQLRTDSLEPILRQHTLLRDKMWYIADVRTSAAYDEARSIAAALRVMGKPKRQPRTRIAPPLRHWNIPKPSSTSLHLKTEAQILEILSARPDHGGPNKLSDEQSLLVELWMDRQNVDNLCRGEERLHKLCMEIWKCVDVVTATSSVDHPSLQSNILFARDNNFAQEPAFQRRATFHPALPTTSGSHNYLSLTSQARSNDTLSTVSRALSSVSSQDYLESRSPTLTNQSSIPFWSPSTTEVDSRSSATSIRTSRTQSAMHFTARKSTAAQCGSKSKSIDTFRQRVTSLLLSDLTPILFNDGSETDQAYWGGLGRELTDRHFRGLQALQASVGSQTPRTDFSIPLSNALSHFDFDHAFRTLFAKFSAMSNPATKLACLYDMDMLLIPYVAEKIEAKHDLTSLRAGSESGDRTPARRVKDSAETSITGFRDLFLKSWLRPATIFRDLQYIAALIPSSVLQDTPQGKAFYHAAVAISGLKREARTVMVETADSIIAYHSNNRGHGRSSSMAQQQRDSAIFTVPSRTPSAEDVSRYSMADAGYLYQIAAREGDIVAQRELATLYLTHPDLMDRIVAPFARPKDVFKDELESKWRKNQDPNRCDPTTMCVAHHWMSLSSKGGDSLAKEYLRQREEMDSF